jgi:hypothetical protein
MNGASQSGGLSGRHTALSVWIIWTPIGRCRAWEQDSLDPRNVRPRTGYAGGALKLANEKRLVCHRENIRIEGPFRRLWSVDLRRRQDEKGVEEKNGKAQRWREDDRTSHIARTWN